MEPLPPIPTPLPQRWREFRIQVLPVIFFICIVTALVMVWKNYVQPLAIVGEVESIKAHTVSLIDGTLVTLDVDRFDRVTKGQVLGEVRTATPELLSASLAALAADLKITSAQLDIDRTRGLNSYSSMRLQLLTERIDLNLARIHLEQAEKQYERIEKLYQEGVIPAGEGIGIAPSGRDEVGYDVAKRDRDMLRAEVEDRTRLVAEWEREIQRVEATGIGEVSENESLIQETIAAKERELQATLAPVQLVAPIEGIVSFVYRRPGEQVVRGEPIVTVNATRSERIIGYIREPISRVPTSRDVVIVRKRGIPPMQAEARIIEVGAQLELINPMLISTDSNWVEMGLPFLVGVPPTLQDQLLPGQKVDLTIHYAESPAP